MNLETILVKTDLQETCDDIFIDDPIYLEEDRIAQYFRDVNAEGTLTRFVSRRELYLMAGLARVTEGGIDAGLLDANGNFEYYIAFEISLYRLNRYVRLGCQSFGKDASVLIIDWIESYPATEEEKVSRASSVVAKKEETQTE
jgi:hypothetical protein